MRKLTQHPTLFPFCTFLLALSLCCPVMLRAQAQDRSVTVYQYRRVPPDKTAEFIKRETTYWAKVAEKATKDKTMTFWALLEKMGGHDLPNSSNFLFVNTFPDIDKVDQVFSNPEATAGVKMADMETNSFSTTTGEYFLHEQNFAGATKAPPDDYKYITFNYQNTNYPDSLINLEKKYWQPFIQKAMDNGQTPQVAWGNATFLAPVGGDAIYSTVSYDIFKSLQDALMTNWDPKTVFPTKGLGMINKLALARPGIVVYRIVKVVMAPM